MGEHAAITAKQMGIKRVDQDELAAASHRNMSAAYDRGFFDDLVTPFLGLYRDNNLRPDSSAEKLAKLKPVFGVKAGDATMTAGNSTPLTDGASVALLSTEDWAATARARAAGVLRRRRDRRGRLRQRPRRPADGADVRGAAAVGPKRAEPCRTSTSTRSTRRSRRWCWRTSRRGSPRSTARSGSGWMPRSGRSTGPSSTSTARRSRRGTRSPRPAGASSPNWPSSWPRRRSKQADRQRPVRGLISICAAGGQGVAAILEA